MTLHSRAQSARQTRHCVDASFPFQPRPMVGEQFWQVGKNVFQRQATSPPMPNHLGKSGLTK